MKSTKILLNIVFILIFLIVGYICIVKRDEIKTYAYQIIDKYKSDKIIIPNYKSHYKDYKFKTVSETDNFVPSNIDDLKNIYYTVLNNGWESFTFYCPKSYTECANDVKSLANSKYTEIINNYVSPLNSYIKYNTLIVNDDKINLKVDKLYTNDEITKLDAFVNKFINDNKINVKNPTKKDIKLIHDYLVDNITYDKKYKEGDETVSNKATTAIFNKIAICSGYTDAFAIFLDKLNIPNFKVTTEDHVWNLIYFDNKWTHIDVTWDDDEVNKDNNHNFFMIDTKKLLEIDDLKHNFEKSDYLELN